MSRLTHLILESQTCFEDFAFVVCDLLADLIHAQIESKEVHGPVSLQWHGLHVLCECFLRVVALTFAPCLALPPLLPPPPSPSGSSFSLYIDRYSYYFFAPPPPNSPSACFSLQVPLHQSADDKPSPPPSRPPLAHLPIRTPCHVSILFFSTNRLPTAGNAPRNAPVGLRGFCSISRSQEADM